MTKWGFFVQLDKEALRYLDIQNATSARSIGRQVCMTGQKVVEHGLSIYLLSLINRVFDSALFRSSSEDSDCRRSAVARSLSKVCSVSPPDPYRS